MSDETVVPTMTRDEVEAACHTLHKGETARQCELRHYRERVGYQVADAVISDLCERHAVEQIPAGGK